MNNICNGCGNGVKQYRRVPYWCICVGSCVLISIAGMMAGTQRAGQIYSVNDARYFDCKLLALLVSTFWVLAVRLSNRDPGSQLSSAIATQKPLLTHTLQLTTQAWDAFWSLL